MAVPSNDFFEKSRFSYKMATGPASFSRTTYMVMSGRVATFHFTSVICICSSSRAVMHPGCTQLPAAVSVCVNGRQSDNGREVWSSPPGTVHTGPPFYNCAPHSWDHSRRSAPTVSTRSAPELWRASSTQN